MTAGGAATTAAGNWLSVHCTCTREGKSRDIESEAHLVDVAVEGCGRAFADVETD